MSSQRSTIHIAAPTVEGIDLDKDSGESLSGRIALIIERYREIVARHSPDLSRNEWCAVLDVMNGMFVGLGDTHAVRYIWASLSDALKEGLAEKWGIDGPALVEKLRALDYAGCVAVAEVSRRFWARSKLDTDEALQQALEIVKKPGAIG